NPVIAIESARRVIADVLGTTAASVCTAISGKARDGASDTSSTTTAVNEVRDFLSELTEPPETDGERFRMTSTVRALDHVSRLVENLAGFALPETQAGQSQDLGAAALCEKTMTAVQKVSDSISTEAALSEQAPPIGWNVSADVRAALSEA